MKKIYIFLVFSFLLGYTKVLAECDYAEQARLNNLAGLVTSEYQTYEQTKEYYDEGFGETVTLSYWYGRINIYNITSDLYVEVEDLGTFYSNEDNVITIDTGLTDEIREYSIDILAVEPACDKDPIRTLHVTIPRLNPYSSYPQCLEYPDYYYCNKFVFLDEISESDFLAGINAYAKREDSINNNDKNFFDKILDFFKNYYVSIIIIIVVIIIFIVGFKIWKQKEEDKMEFRSKKKDNKDE